MCPRINLGDTKGDPEVQRVTRKYKGWCLDTCWGRTVASEASLGSVLTFVCLGMGGSGGGKDGLRVMLVVTAADISTQGQYLLFRSLCYKELLLSFTGKNGCLFF